MNNNTTILKNVICQMSKERSRTFMRGVVCDSSNRICAYEKYTLIRECNYYLLKHTSFRNGSDIDRETWYILESRENRLLESLELMEWAKTPWARNVIVTRVHRNY